MPGYSLPFSDKPRVKSERPSETLGAPVFKQADDGYQEGVRALKNAQLTSSVMSLLEDGGKCFLSLQPVAVGLAVRSNGCLSLPKLL